MKALISLLGIVAAVFASGCVVAPAGRAYEGQAGVVYVAPAYASPGPGYVWEHHPQYGWGWHHPERGWDKGWR